jgi:hypothetical protein
MRLDVRRTLQISNGAQELEDTVEGPRSSGAACCESLSNSQKHNDMAEFSVEQKAGFLLGGAANAMCPVHVPLGHDSRYRKHPSIYCPLSVYAKKLPDATQPPEAFAGLVEVFTKANRIIDQHLLVLDTIE